jgi:pimeloyl-ACP methyl ester carboxylesterase
VDDVLFVPPWAKIEQYSRLLYRLQDIGYRVVEPDGDSKAGGNVYTFAYDWRQDNRISGRQLAEKIERWQTFHPGAKAWIIGHSMGGIIARWYIEKEGGKDHVDRLFLMGSPWDGAPKAMTVLFAGLSTLFRRFFELYDVSRRTRDLFRTFPSAYQLLPYKDPFLQDENNQVVDLFADTKWLDDDRQQQLLVDGQAFNLELGTNLSVETICFFGLKQRTTTAGRVRFEAAGRWHGITWEQTEAGDGTVPLRSAVHPNAQEKIPGQASHGDIYVNAGVLDKLEWELIGRYELGTLALVTVDELQVQFEPDKDVYSPGEDIQVWVTVQNVRQNTPVSGARVEVQLTWREALPGSDTAAPPGALSRERLSERASTPGRYEGRLPAPDGEGYYQLQAIVEVAAHMPVLLEELLLVEHPPQAVIAAPAGQTRGQPSNAAGEQQSARPVEPPTLEFDDFVLGTLGPEDEEASPLAFDERTPSDELPSERFINTRIQDRDDQVIQGPLQMGVTYLLSFDVNTTVAGDGSGVMSLMEPGIFAQGEQLAELTVHLSSKDFRIWSSPLQGLWVPRTGRSKNLARFDIEPKQEGVGQVTAHFYRNNNWIQGMTLQIRTGGSGDRAIVGEQAIGRSPEGALAVQPRHVSLVIKKDNGFDVTLIGSGAAQATLELNDLLLDRMIEQARQAINDVVKYQLGTVKVYQTGKAVPEEANQWALRHLATAGWRLFRGLFLDTNSLDVKRIGTALRNLVQGARQSRTTLKIQIVSTEFVLPWSMLYITDRFDAENVDPDCFLGLRHIVEHIPYLEMPALDSTIAAQPLHAGIHLAARIDQQPSRQVPPGLLAAWKEVIDEQRAFWTKVGQSGGASVDIRDSSDLVWKALTGEDTPDHIVYFYGHAKAADLKNPDGASLEVNERIIRVQDLKDRAPTEQKLPGVPLVFINACESAELSPLFYRGFMPYFTQRGARGLIGTECDIPALFAKQWARRFFEDFLAGGRSLGQVMLDLRREFYTEQRNLLGLAYALYCDADTRIIPGVQMQ